MVALRTQLRIGSMSWRFDIIPGLGRVGGRGNAIMIHGGWKSIGCLAVGDQAAEDLFVLAADTGWESAVVVIRPVDFRRAALPVGYRAPAPWVPQLYGQLRARMFSLPAPAWAPANSFATGAH